MKEKVIQVQVTSDTFIQVYLSLFYSSLHLTKTEQKVLEIIVENYLKLKGKVQEPYLTELVLSSERRREVCTSVGISAPHLNNTIKSLKEKDIFLDQDALEIDPRLIPHNNLRFEFVIEDIVEFKTTEETEEIDETVPTESEQGLLKTKVEEL